jgi:hypothetical protein
LRRSCPRARRLLCGRRLRKSYTGIPIEMVFAAGRAVALAGVFIAQAGQFIAAAHTITVAGFRSSFDGNQRHRVSPAKEYMRKAPEESAMRPVIRERRLQPSRASIGVKTRQFPGLFGRADEAAEKGLKPFPQGLKPASLGGFTPGLQPRPPKEKLFPASCEAEPTSGVKTPQSPRLLGTAALRCAQGKKPCPPENYS